MIKSDIIERDIDTSEFLIEPDYNINEESEPIYNFNSRGRNYLPKIILLSGILTFSSLGTIANSDLNTLSTENIDDFFKSYTDFDNYQYIEEINKISKTTNYTKLEIIKDILAFKTLCNNWDGYGAYPLEIDSASNAISLIDKIGEEIFCRVNDYFPNPNGTISFIWTNDDDEVISLEIGNQLMSYYVELNSKKVLYYNNIEINDKEAKKISEYIQLL